MNALIGDDLGMDSILDGIGNTVIVTLAVYTGFMYMSVSPYAEA